MATNPNTGAPISMPAAPVISAVPAPPVLDPELEELWSSRALLIVLGLLILSFWVSYYLKIRRIRSIHETLVALFAGMCVGLLVRLSPGNVIQDMVSFKNTILLNVLLPPIILNSGYQLKQENFFRNFGVILTFAFAGTFISAVVLGVIVYIYSLLGFEGFSLTIVECLLFGSTLSATDPVTILAIFNALHVDPKLYSVIFGESILNDAVAIVMFETLSQFHGEKIHVLSFFHGTGIFLLTFFISMALGVIFGLGCSLMLKHSQLGRYTEIESCLVFLIAYTSYFFSNAFTMSGIVSLLFCGITLKHYAYHNMSHRTQRTSRYMFGMLAQLSENFIFIYLGLSLFTATHLVYKPMFILVTALAVCVARYCAVFPISRIINIYFKARGQRNEELPHSYQVMLFWAGLRGAVGVALAAGMKGDNAVALQTTVLVTVVLTVVVFGGTIGRMIEILGIRTGVEEDDDESSDDDGLYALAGEDDSEAFRPTSKAKRRTSVVSGNAGGSKNLSKKGSNNETNSPTSSAESPAAYNYRDRLAQSSSNQRGDQSPSVGSDESDTDVLPAMTAEGGAQEKPGDLTRVWRDGQWFTVLDERYLLPVFSNATASRRQASKKALRTTQRNSFANDREFQDAMLPSNRRTNLASTNPPEFNGSFSDILSSLVSPSPTSVFNSHKRRDSPEYASSADDLGSTIDLNLTSLSSTNPVGAQGTMAAVGSGSSSGTGSSRAYSRDDRRGSASGRSTPVAQFASPKSNVVAGASKRGSSSNYASGSDGSNASGGSAGGTGSSRRDER